MLRVIFAALAVFSLAACEEGDVMKEIDRKREERLKVEQAQAQKDRDFLVQNATKPGVKQTPSGLQYEVVRTVAQDVPRPTAVDKVKVSYEGRLINGAVFDSSYARGEPIEFVLNEVIPGWTEGLQLMKPGEEFNLYIPADIGYGARGAGADIPLNATLIFRVELLQFTTPDGKVVKAP